MRACGAKRSKGGRGIAWIWVMILSWIAGCQPPTSPDYFGTVRPLHGPDELWINNGAEPEWIDPNKCSDGNGGDVIFNTFAGLMVGQPDSLEPAYDLAQSFTMDDTQTHYEFQLRPSQWSDGKALTAHDFEWSWKRLLDPATASKYNMMGFIFRNGEAFNRGAVLVTRSDALGSTTPPTPASAGPADPAATAALSTTQSASPAGKVEDEVAGLRALLPAEWQQAEIRPSVAPAGWWIFPLNEKVTESRQGILASFQGKTWDGQALQARLATHHDVGVRARGDLELAVDLESPTPFFLNLLGYYTFMPVPRHVIERLEQAGINPDLWTRPEHFVSNGAYVLKEWQFRQYMVFEKNPHFWQAESVKIQRVRAMMIESYNTALNMYKAGSIDWPGSNTSIPAEYLDYLRQFKDFRQSPYLAVYFYWINTQAPPMDNVLVRRAFSLAIDREKITKYVTRAGQIPYADLVPEGLAGYQGLGSPVFDPERARALLAEAGYPGGQGLPKVSLIYNTAEAHKQVAVAIQQMWKEHLNVPVELVNQEWGVYLKRMQQTDFQIARMGWIGDYADPNTFLELLASHNGNNHSNWKNPAFDELLKRANSTLEPARRLELLREAERLGMGQQPLIPIYIYTRSQLVKPYVRGIHGNFQDRHLWRFMSIDDRWYNGIPSEPGSDPLPNLTPVRPSEN